MILRPLGFEITALGPLGHYVRSVTATIQWGSPSHPWSYINKAQAIVSTPEPWKTKAK